VQRVFSGVFWCFLVFSGVFWCFLVFSGVFWCFLVFSGVFWCFSGVFLVFFWCFLVFFWCFLVFSGLGLRPRFMGNGVLGYTPVYCCVCALFRDEFLTVHVR